MTSFLELAAGRYSVRGFKPDPVPPELMSKILEACRLAPTACNYQPQRIKVITDPRDVEIVDECTPCRFGAPATLLICYDQSLCWRNMATGVSSGHTDAVIAGTHMMLAAHDLGLGCCWIMKFDGGRLARQFELPDDIVPIALLPTGYPSDDAAPSEQHGQRLAIEEFLLKY